MKLPNNIWLYVKVALLAASVLVAFVRGPEPIDSGDSPAPLWLVPIPFVFLALFLPVFLVCFEETGKYLNQSPWPAFPFSVFRDPLPFWHLGGWVGLLISIPQLAHALAPYDQDQFHLALMTLSTGLGAYVGVWVGKRRFIRKRQDVEPLA